MNILVAIDVNYLEQLITMLNSLFINNRCKMRVYLLYGTLPESALHKLKLFIEKNGNQLYAIKVKKELFKDAPQRAHTSVETYYRLLAFQILDQSIEKILYLDPDMIVTGSILPLYKTDLKNKCFAGAPDYGINELYPTDKQNLRIPKKYQYINAGMLLMNLKRIRQKMTVEQLFKLIADNRSRFKLQDQDVINACFYDEIVYVPVKYNHDIWYHNMGDIITYPLRQYVSYSRPIIIHYMGSEYKPWNRNGFGGKYIREYLRYCSVEETIKLRRQVIRNRKNWIKSYFYILKRFISGDKLCK